ncbi:MAG: glycogen-binding domain-containing protein [Candidatus Omnitrophica bacterium]|nr:glycogen-binding domain-containing protein [Candidatus Omnitrophota bacterium]
MPRLMGSKPIEFKLYAPSAKKVVLSGSFNKWDTKKLPGKKDSKGNWVVKTSLKPGKYEYKFFVDGSWQNDSNSTVSVPNAFGTHNSVIEVK